VSPAFPRLLVLAALTLCSCAQPVDGVEERGASDDQVTVQLDRSDVPLLQAAPDELARFDEGDVLFETMLREADGLGPVYVRASCQACHAGDGRGPGLVSRVAVVERDGVTPSRDQTRVPFGSVVRPYAAGGAKRAVLAPTDDPSIRLTHRFPPAVFGRGHIEAVADEAIEQLARAAAERTGPIRGRVNRVTYQSLRNPGATLHSYDRGTPNLIGRFGLKARVATLDDFVADALQGDMGITSPLRPDEPPNPEGRLDDAKPGIDVDLTVVNALTDYVRLLEIPQRRSGSARGRELFGRLQCATCHIPSLETRGDYPVRGLAAKRVEVYTDLLLHDMGPSLADGVEEGSASSREWRTAPLIGLRFSGAFLHDGRAKTLRDAVLAHGDPESEARETVRAFSALNDEDQDELLSFVSTL